MGRTAGFIFFFLALQLLTDPGFVCAAPQEDGPVANSPVSLANRERSRALERQKTGKAADATLTGRIVSPDKNQMVNWMVYLFNKSMGPPPSRDKYWRVPDLISGVDADGSFSVAISEGTYYLTAAQKDPDAEMGPPTEREFHYFHGDPAWNPLPLAVASGATLNLGALPGAFLWTPEMSKSEEGVTSIAGTVTDMAGKPLEGAVIFAYLSQDITGRPVFISERTGKEGSYQLRVHGGGTFYLKVRSVYGGGSPETGEYLNITDEFKPFSVTLRKGQKLQGIAIQVKKFPKRGPKDMKK